jgi:hypothetical protein
MEPTGKQAISRRSVLGILAAAAAFLLARLPWRRNNREPTKARYWRRLGGKS